MSENEKLSFQMSMLWVVVRVHAVAFLVVQDFPGDFSQNREVPNDRHCRLILAGSKLSKIRD